MKTEWTEWNGHLIRVKPDWVLTRGITDFVVDSLRGAAASYAAENQWDLVADLMKTIGFVWFGTEERRKSAIESVLWEWATDAPEFFKRFPAVTKVLDIREIDEKTAKGGIPNEHRGPERSGINDGFPTED